MKRISLIQLLMLVGAIMLLSNDGVAADIQTLIQKGDERLQEITEANAKEDIAVYEAALKIDPENYEANWKTSKAYCLILDLKTAGLIEEKEEYKPLLKELGEKAEFSPTKLTSGIQKG